MALYLIFAIRRLRASTRTVAIFLVVSGNAAIVISLGWLAYRKLADRCGCYFW